MINADVLIIFALGILASLLGGILRDDAKTWIPRVARRLVERAASNLPIDDAQRFCEEWLAHADELQESTSKIAHALECLFVAAPRIHAEREGITLYRAIARRGFDLTAVSLCLPLLLPVTISLCLFFRVEGHPVFKRHKVTVAPGKVVTALTFLRLCCTNRVTDMVSLSPDRLIPRLP